ncbi:hypothetical protein [Kitasatospora sp. NPDC091207]|uniref:hypothetical protein n=1 Tax=Kitasatospora sp. NPDC091207 TaxID=3364083 RepID=UPI003807831B
MTADGGRARGRGGGGATARLLLLCGLLAGLFLMHGSPTAAAGCHGPTPVTAAASGHGAHGADGIDHARGPAPAGTPDLDRRRAPGGDPRAVSCVSARDRERAGLPVTAPLAAGAAVVPPEVPEPAATQGRRATGPRAPPDAGRRLLLRVCVART